MSSRRSFLSSVARTGVALPVMAPALRPSAIRNLLEADRMSGGRAATALADDESYWGEIQRAFDSDRSIINLNNGGGSPAPTHVLEQMIRDLKFSNEEPV